jgi:hypothetical protein
LLESGGAGWDLEKQSLRRMNAAIILDALISIADESYLKESTDLYTNLATNERQIFDIKITKAPLNIGGNHRGDIGINLVETAHSSGEITYSWSIEEVGDLSYMHALNQLDGSKWSLPEGQITCLGANITSLIFTENNTIAFDLSTFTAKIN